MLAPLVDGTYGLYGDLKDAPNGAVYRGMMRLLFGSSSTTKLPVWRPLTGQVSTRCWLKRTGRTFNLN